MAKRLRAAAEGSAVWDHTWADLVTLAQWCEGLAKYPKILSAIGRKESHERWGRYDHLAWHATILKRLAKLPQPRRVIRQSWRTAVATHWDVPKKMVTAALNGRAVACERKLDELIKYGREFGKYSEMEVLEGEKRLAEDRLKTWTQTREKARAKRRKI